MAALKYSRQREAIKAFLMTRKDHPTADVVYANVRQEFPNISLGTVYRNLSLLVDLGEIIKVPCRDGSEHFDATTQPHLHFSCLICGAVLDLEVEDESLLDKVNKEVSKNFDGRIEGNEIFFYGKCPNCVDKVAKNA